MTQLDQDIASYTRKLERISTIDIPRATSSALTKTARLVRTEASRQVAIKENIKVGSVRKRFFTRVSTAKTQVARIVVYARPVSAISLFTPGKLAQIDDGFGNTGAGVTVRGRTFATAFIARGPKGSTTLDDGAGHVSDRTGPRQVFFRKGRGRLPLKKAEIPIYDAATQVTESIAKRFMVQDYPRLLRQDLKFRVERHGKRTAKRR